MFKSARLKLTLWYLLIIMLVSACFSVVIYVGLTRELERGFHRAEIRFRAEELDIPLPRRWLLQPENLDPRLQELRPHFFLIEDLAATKKRLILNLLVVNGVILGLSALVGYFLAGKTLKPIEEALEEQKRFVADASHEFRTPLTALKTSMEVALRDKKMSLRKAKEVIKSNLEDIDGLESLSNKLLSLARYQDNGHNLLFNDVDIAGVIENACRKILPLAKEKRIEIRLEVKKQTIQANKESLEEMMVIFLDNAVKYTPPKGRVTVTTRVDKRCLFIEVADTGIGIAKEDIPHIFDRFYRLDKSRSKIDVPGFGLGLSLAKRIVEMHKGSVKVSSILNKGTAFTIKFPLKHS
jgi:two-component system sensor histidine kinase CiaH